MKRILVVAMVDSIHTARWLEQFEDSQDEFLLFPSSPHRRIHPKIRHLIGNKSPMKISIPRGLRQTGLLLAAIDKLVANRSRGYILRRIITRYQPEILHAMETQGAGYICCVALSRVQSRPFFILTEWGSDLFWFRRFPRHEIVIRKLLKEVKLLVMECHRDVQISRELGYEGEIYPPYAYTGGYDLSFGEKNLAQYRTSHRKLILIKGHTRFVGRALIALNAIEAIRADVDGYQIIVYSADPKARRRVRKLKNDLEIRSFKRGALTHDQFLELVRRARIYIGISLSDAASISFLEAMVYGAFPIQTDTSCANEWIENGKSGFIVRADDLAGISQAIKTALEDDALVDLAAELNFRTAQNRLDHKIVSEMSRNFYSSTNI